MTGWRVLLLLCLLSAWITHQALADSQIVVLSNDTSLTAGETTILVCVGDGDGNQQISWSFNGEAVMNSSLVTIYEEETVQGERVFLQSFLQLCSLEPADAGAYTCVVSNGLTSVNSSVLLAVAESNAAVELVVLSNDTSLDEGETALLACVGYGLPDVEITWLHDETTLTNSSLVSIYEEEVLFGDRLFKQSMLQLCSVDVADSGSYICSVNNSLNSVMSVVQLDVVDPRVEVYIAEPAQISFAENSGSSVSFECRADGYPLPSITWLRNGGVIIASLSGGKFEVETMTLAEGLRPDLMETAVSVLTISNLSPLDSGEYTCRGSNSVNSVFLPTAFSLTVVSPTPPDFCSPNPCLNGGTCTSGSTMFQCRCMDQYTGITCDIAVTVAVEPELIEVPEPVFVPLFGQANMSCVATGSPQPTLQWYKDGSLLDGVTNSLLIFEEVTLDNRGFYHCSAANDEGMVTSAPAVLSIRNVRQYLTPAVITDSTLFAQTSVAMLVEQLNEVAAGLDVNGQQTIFLYRIELFGSPTGVDDVYLELIVTLLDVEDVSGQPAPGILEAALLVEQLLKTEFQVQNCSIQVENIRRFDGCDGDFEPLLVDGQERAELQWNEVAIAITAEVECPCSLVSVPRKASRTCGGDFVTGGVWMESDKSPCEFDSLALELCEATEIAMVDALTSDPTTVTSLSVTITTSFIEQMMVFAVGNTTVSDEVFSVVNNIMNVPVTELRESQEEFNSTNRVRGVVEELVEFYPITQIPQPIVQQMFGCSLYPSLGTRGLSFSPSFGDNIQLDAQDDSDLSIALPPSLSASVGQNVAPAFCAYRTESLFVRRESYLIASGRNALVVSSSVVTARFSRGVKVSGLVDPVTMDIKKNKDVVGKTMCSFWDQQRDGGYGDWSQDGCRLMGETSDTARCECDHLTDFALVVDTSVQPDRTIGRFTIIGAAVMLVCVLVVLLCLLFTPEVRVSAYGLVVVNFCVAMLCLYITFIISYFVGGSESACKAFSFFFHYFLLVCSLALCVVSFFTGWAPFSGNKRRLTFLTAVITNWVIPLIIVAICIGANVDSYYDEQAIDPYCRPVSGPYWYGLLLVAGMFLLLTAVFIVLLPVQVKYGQDSQELKSVLGSPRYTNYVAVIVISICFYLAWGFILPALRPLNLGVVRIVFEVIFIVCSSLMGLVMVLCYILLAKHVRSAFCLHCRRGSVTFRETRPENDYAMTGGVEIIENPTAEAPPPAYETLEQCGDVCATGQSAAAATDDSKKETLEQILAADDEEVDTTL